MDTRPIGVFDSGLGGLTAVRSLREILPEEDLVYFGDTARVPYGGRARETLLKYARQDVRFLQTFDLKAILIACGTVSTTCLEALQAENDLPIVGVVEPTCRRALAVTKTGKTGVIATLASIRSGAYEACLRRLNPQPEDDFLDKASPAQLNPDAAPAAENAPTDNAALWAAILERAEESLPFGIIPILTNPLQAVCDVEYDTLRLRVAPGFYYNTINKQDVLMRLREAANLVTGRSLKVQLSELSSEPVAPKRSLDELKKFKETRFI